MKYQLTYLTEQPYKFEFEGEVLETTEPEHRLLAYPILHQQSLYYQTVLFESDQKQAKQLEKKLATDEHVIRHLLVKNPPLSDISNVKLDTGKPNEASTARTNESKPTARDSTGRSEAKKPEPTKPVDDKQLEAKLEQILQGKQN